MKNEVPRPSRAQYTAARAITSWYLERYFRTDADMGLADMFCRRDRVGAFAVDPRALARGDDRALFQLLVTVTMFQRRSDQQIMRVLRGIPRAAADEMTDPVALLRLADTARCEHLSDPDAIRDRCDLSKDPVTKRGRCGERPDAPCHLKRHTELLKRYGHFGKVPTSAALTVREAGAGTLSGMYARVWEEQACPTARARALEAGVSRAWRVSEKIAAMFLSAVTNRDISGDLAPWADGVDSSHFVVIDSNVDLFLKSSGYAGPMTYGARRAFLQMLAARVRLDELHPGMQQYNPRIVQQALYMFMSVSNRKASDRDCSRGAPETCAGCRSSLVRLCSLSSRRGARA